MPKIWGRLGCSFHFTTEEMELLIDGCFESALYMAFREGRVEADGDSYAVDDDLKVSSEGSMGLPCIMSVPRKPTCMVRKDLVEKGEWIPTEDGGSIGVGYFWGVLDEERDQFNTRLEDAYGNFIAYVNSIDLDWL